MNKLNNWINRSINLGLSYKAIATLILLSFMSTITEVFGVSIFLPILQFIQFDGDLDALTQGTDIWGYVINAFDFFGSTPSLEGLLLISFSLFLFRQIFVYMRVVYYANISQYITQKQRTRMFSSYIKADSSYHDSMPVGNLVNVMTTEVTRAVNGIMAPTELVVLFIMLLGYLTILFFLSWEMTVVSIIVLFLTTKIPTVWVRKSREVGRSFVDANNSMSEFLVGRLHSPRLIRLAGLESAEKEDFKVLTQFQRNYAVLISRLRAKTEVSMEPVVIGMSMIFLYFAITTLKLEIELIGLYLIIILRLMPIVKSIVVQWQSVQRFLGSIEVIEDRILKMESSVEVDAGEIQLNEIKHNIRFEHVSYLYSSGITNALKEISFEITANQITAIVGPSGSGKSTLIDLLPCIRKPTQGKIFFDEINLDLITLRSLRNLISYAPQQPQIFEGTIKHHILYGKRDASDSEIRRAAHLAGADKFIDELINGYDTMVGENATKLSGGERQRLDLARALLSQSPILILDEPASNLDANSAKVLNRAIERIKEETQTTVIIVAHNLSSIAYSDRIIVLQNGEIEGVGTHKDLMESSAWYSNAWKLQKTTL